MTGWGGVCAKCGHPASYHGMTFCVTDAGGTVKRPCDCDGWAAIVPVKSDSGVRAALWHQVAERLAGELARWGWGDMHYGDQPQEKSVTDALAVYENAKVLDGENVTWLRDDDATGTRQSHDESRTR